MTPASRRTKPTDGALRAAKEIERNPSFIESIAEVIDRETGTRELVEILEHIIAEAGDLIESRSPELVAQAHAVLRHHGDESRRQGE
jgi:iron-sulfur cluster repair protein YtfE (RIC family)